MLRVAPARDAAAELTRPGVASRILACFAIHDLVLFGHLATMWTLVALAHPVAGAVRSAHRVEACIAILLLGCVVARGTRLPARLRSGLYRFVMVGTVLASYLMLRWSLPVVQPGSYDGPLNAIDIAVFGAPPTVWLEPLMSPAVVEYLAFFYFSYFTICGGFALLSLGPQASQRTSAEFAVGTSIVFGVGQLGYVLVPGFGPTHHLAHLYQGPLEGGFFWRCVLATVAAGSAMKDIFPSLHTAAPVWFALFAAGRARRTGARSWRILSWVTGFFAANIVVSTVLLRWHYTIDLVAGLALAAAAAWAAPRLADLEAALRKRHGLPPAWEFEP